MTLHDRACANAAEGWKEADGQTTYTKLLRELEEPKDFEDVDRRLDILGVLSGGGVTVVELKRPEATLSRKHLEQIERYVDWMRNQFDTSSSVKYVDGLLVVGRLSTSGDVKRKLERVSGDDIRVETYEDLHRRATEYYATVEQALKQVAPEYARK